MSDYPRFTGLIAATHSPFQADGSLNLAMVERQAEHFLSSGVKTVFIGGSTGESHSLSLDERQRLAERWFAVTRGMKLDVIVHVGANCLADARQLAAQAERLGAMAISALAPSYFKPNNVEALVACCEEIASAAFATPFYFYDIPSMTGVQLSMPDFLERAAKRIPNLTGIKFTNVDLMSYQLCREAAGGKFDILWGVDEMLLAALALGVRGGVGSTYNFAAPLYHRIIAAFENRDFETGRREQFRSVQLIQTLMKRGYMASAKSLMTKLGVDVGPPRLPSIRLTAEQTSDLWRELEPFSDCFTKA